MARQLIYDAFCVLHSGSNVLGKSLALEKEKWARIIATSSLLKGCRQEPRHRPGHAAPKAPTPPPAAGQTARTYSTLCRSPRLGSHLGSPRFYSTDRDRAPRKTVGEKEKPEYVMESSPVPSNRFERLLHYGSLATGMGIGAISETIRRRLGDENAGGSVLLNPANLERLVKKLSQMRGAALKVGQLLSFQDEKVLPPEIQRIMTRVQNTANYMPRGQLERVMSRELGKNWRSEHFSSFEDYPVAAASIGQVHKAVTLKDYEMVAVKVQYPGVANSIDSDLNNLLLLLTASRFLPEGLFLDKTIANARTELKWETDYLREAQNMETFREFFKDDDVFAVPRVYHDASTEHVLTMEFMRGTEITKGNWDQDTKNHIATQIMRLCLLEIAKFRFMQTDPNWANFLYNDKTGKIELLDFGAARGYSDTFIENYLGVLRAAVRKDRQACEEYSLKLGYLTGLESQAMLDAHIDSILVLGEPFSPADNSGKPFSFVNQTITDRVRTNIGLMLRERLTPPPEETYGLHRKLSGAFLLCAKLNATVPCQQLFEDIVGV